jgi:hypothetical protein
MYAEASRHQVAALDVTDRWVVLNDHHQSWLHDSIEQSVRRTVAQRGRLLTFLEHSSHRALTWRCHSPGVPEIRRRRKDTR